MRLLLDTHVFLWVLSGDQRLGPDARHRISVEADVVLVSVLALWEIALKWAQGRMPIDAARASAALSASGFERLDVQTAHILALGSLPARRDHKDPFDRMLVAQARHEGLTLVTADEKLAAYDVPILGCS